MWVAPAYTAQEITHHVYTSASIGAIEGIIGNKAFLFFFWMVWVIFIGNVLKRGFRIGDHIILLHGALVESNVQC